MFILILLYQLAQGCADAVTSALTSSEPNAEETPLMEQRPCPERIARELPGTNAELVEAFLTDNKQITLCRTEDGDLYYFGEYTDGREPGIVMPASETSDGYEARNGPYRYVIHDGVVTIYENRRQIGEESLSPDPSPN